MLFYLFLYSWVKCMQFSISDSGITCYNFGCSPAEVFKFILPKQPIGSQGTAHLWPGTLTTGSGQRLPGTEQGRGTVAAAFCQLGSGFTPRMRTRAHLAPSRKCIASRQWNCQEKRRGHSPEVILTDFKQWRNVQQNIEPDVNSPSESYPHH